MKGLLLKDWYMMVKYCKAWVVILVVMIGASAFSDNPFLFLMYPVMLAGLTAVTLIAYDERSGWSTLSRAMPYSAAQLVSVKYLVVLLLLAAAAVIAAAAQLLRPYLGAGSADNLPGVLGMLLSAGLFVPAVLLPFVFRFGVSIGCMVFLSMSVEEMPQITAGNAVSALALPVCALLYALSWLLSIRLYRPHV